MLSTIVLTVLLFALAIGAMAIGVAFSGKRLAGSCGGVGGDACTCGPEKRAACHARSNESDHDEYVLDPLARPGEDRLIQLRRN